VGYHSNHVLGDPFCGSATLLIEAAMMASNTPAGFFRKSFGFFYLPEFSSKNWERVKEEMNQKRSVLQRGKFLGADNDPKVLDIAYENVNSAGFDGCIDFINRDIRDLRHPISPSLIVTNPPYGKRLQISPETLKALGKFIQTRCQKEAKAFALSPAESSSFYKDFSAREKLSCFNGGMSVSLYELYFS